jgi:ATP-dependent Clp protease protease subunit
MKKFWNWVRDEDTDSRTLYLNGVIAEESWFEDDVTPAAFKEELLSGKGDIIVWINSPGGDCIAAAQIYNMLMDYKGNVTVKIDGIAASAASVISMAVVIRKYKGCILASPLPLVITSYNFLLG